MTKLSEKIVKFFLDAVAKEFRFLVEEYGFSEPKTNLYAVEIKYVYMLWYMGKNVALEFSIEWIDLSIACFVVQLIDGVIPEGWNFDKTGNLVRDRIASWILDKGITEKLFTRQSSDLSIEERILLEISDYVRMLREHGKQILEDQREIFS